MSLGHYCPGRNGATRHGDCNVVVLGGNDRWVLVVASNTFLRLGSLEKDRCEVEAALTKQGGFGAEKARLKTQDKAQQ